MVARECQMEMVDLQSEKPSRQTGPRVCWAFEGGGAKGAFSFAAAEVLLANDIPVEAVSGTSIGAINALLVSSGEMVNGRKLWTDLKQENVLPYRTWPWLARPVALALIILHSFNWTLHGRRGWVEAGWVRRSLERALFGLVFLPIWCGVISLWLNPEFGWISRVVACLLVFSFVCEIWVNTEDNADYSEHQKLVGMAHMTNAWCVLAVLVWFPITALIWVIKGNSSALENWIYEPILLGLLANVAFSILRTLFLDTAAMSNYPLEEHLRKLLDGKELRIPTFLTVAFRHTRIDPDFPSISTIQFDETSPLEYVVSSRTEHVPLYLQVKDLPMEKVVSAALASAALPFGLVKSVKWEEKDVVDGGVADNVPIRPIIPECDVLVIIRLNLPEIPTTHDLVSVHPDPKKHWQRTWRTEDLVSFDRSSLPMDFDWSRYEWPTEPYDVRYRQIPENWPEVIQILPPESLGDLFDFSATEIDRRLRLGAEAALAKLPEIRAAISKPPPKPTPKAPANLLCALSKVLRQ